MNDTAVKEQVKKTGSRKKEIETDPKLMQKKLNEAFDYLANLTWVIEERTMDVKNIPNLTLGEIHVIEMVSKNNNKPMSYIAKKLKVSVGALTIGVNRIVQKGYIDRTRDDTDHRVVQLSITPLGRKVLKFHDRFHDDIMADILKNANFNEAYRVFTKTAEVLENYYQMKEGKKYE
jgi:DNA-binding MarR family transcriptional regulator